MNIPKIIAELRSELDLLEASIHAFELLEKTKDSEDIFTAVDVGSQLGGIAAEGAENETAMGTTRRKALRSSDRPMKCAPKRSERIRKRPYHLI